MEVNLVLTSFASFTMVKFSCQSSWAAYFAKLNSDNLDMNQLALNVLSVSTEVPNQAFLTTIDSLSKDKGDSILMYYCSITKTMKIIHCVENIGNTSWFNAPLIVAQDGFAKSKSTPVLLDLDSLLNGKEIDVPSQANIFVNSEMPKTPKTIS